MRREILELLNVVISLHGEPNNFGATANERSRDTVETASGYTAVPFLVAASWNLVE